MTVPPPEKTRAGGIWRLIVLSGLIWLIYNGDKFKGDNTRYAYRYGRDQVMMNRIKAQGFNESEADRIYRSAQSLCRASGGRDC